MIPTKPITRIEKYLDGIINDTTLPDPITRIEQYLSKISGDDIAVPEKPITRIEMYLAKIAGEDVEIPEKPITRIEMYLAAIAGEEITVLEPITREEQYLYEWANTPKAEVVTVTGIAPLLLAAAYGSPLRSLTQYGKCEQDGTPTPASPVPIMCNNGELRMVHQSGLPDGYRLLEYVGGSGSQYVITDLYLASTDVVECEYKNSSTTGYGAIYGIYKTGESTALYGNQTYYGYDQANNKVDTGMSVDTDWHSARHDFVNGTLTIDDTTVSFTPWSFTNETKNAVLSRFYNGSYGYNWKGYVRKFKVTRNGDVICDLLPAKNASNVAGLYDLISGNFYTATGGTLTEGNEVDDYELRVVGTPETISVEHNIITSDLDGYGTYVSPTSTAGNRAYKWLNGLSNGTYRFAVDGAYVIIIQWRDPVDPSLTAQSYENLSGWITSGDVTLDKESGGYGIAVRRTSGTSITPDNFDGTLYCIPAPQTATVPNLYAVGDYADDVEIISGGVTRKVGIRILTGEETGWALSDSGTMHRFRGVKPSDCYTPASRAPSVCTHFKYVSTGSAVGGMFIGASQYWYFIPTDQTIDTVDEWTAWLAAQYAQGTPVIVLYPLKEETTESATPQPLSTADGDNVVSATANVSPIQLEVTYERKVS